MRNPARGKRTPIADSLIKTILLKRELWEGWVQCVCVSVLTQDTHTPLSLSHYQLAFHPVSHPSVQMVRKAASVLPLYRSPFSLHILLWRKKKGYASDRLEPNGRDTDWMSGGFNCKRSSQPESWIQISYCSCTAPFYFLPGWQRIQIKRHNSSATHLC